MLQQQQTRGDEKGFKILTLLEQGLECGDPQARTDPVDESGPKPRGHPFNSFILHFIKFSFSKVSRPESPAQPEGRVRTGARFTPTFLFILSKHLFMSFRFKVFNFAEAFSNGRPINIHISQNTITMMAFYAFFKMIYKTKH